MVRLIAQRLTGRALALLGTGALAAALAACGGSSSGGVTAGGDAAECIPTDRATSAQCGTLLVALTDADGDFVSYTVDVLSLTLRRANGATVELLPAATRVDFAQLVDLADLLTAATVAPGDFAGGTIRLDYGNAEVFVEAGGEIVQAQVVDESGAPLGVAELEIELADREHLVITRGRAALLTVDFDLAASHDVDVAQSPPVVAVRPVIVASAAPVEEKPLRVRGALQDVRVEDGEYVIAVRPWHRRDGDHGRFVVHTTSATSFEIGAETYVGSEGLEALAALPDGTLTVAFGTLSTVDRSFTAEIVHARDSVDGVGADAVYGNVVARDGDRLTVKGAYAVRRDGAPRFRRTVLVDVGADTTVLQIGAPGERFGADALSVGQRLVAFGQLAEPADPADVPVLDATQGRVRMLVTRLHGTVERATAGQLDLALRAIDRLPVSAFDFTGTGAAPSLDADPASYEVATSTLPLGTLAPGEAASVLGFVTPFGAAPPDFEGRTVIDHRQLRATLRIGWGPDGTLAPFASLGETGLVLDLGNPDIGEPHHLRAGARVLDLLEMTAAPTLAPRDGRALFSIVERGHVELFTDFGAFTDGLAAHLGAGGAAVFLAAHGQYDEAANTLLAAHVGVYFQRPE
ncbi:MAG TPA: metallophosphoesterase [Gammaproteobacteria bacterium]